MKNVKISGKGLAVARGGSGDHLLVLLHGLGANGSVWGRMLPVVQRSWAGRWVVPDFRGHGQSPFVGPYGYGAHAADIAALIEEEGPESVFIVGHSFGGVVGALLATGWFGPRIAKLFAFGVKLHWSTDEVTKAQALARKPTRTFPTRQEAIERYLKGAGLFGLVGPESEEASLGVSEVAGGYQVRTDPRMFSAVGPSIPEIFSLVDAPFRLAAGAKDPMVSAEEMREFDRSALIFEGCGHNVHYEQPELLWEAISAEMTPAEQERIDR